MRGIGTEGSAAYLPKEHIWYNKDIKNMIIM